MSSDTPSEAVPEPIVAVIELFGSSFADVAFPNVSHEGLVELSTQVRDAAQEVQDTTQRLEDAQAQLAELSVQLRERAAQGLAYAQVYAEHNAELRAKVEGISLTARRPKAPRKRAAAPKRRKREADDNVTELPIAAS